MWVITDAYKHCVFCLFLNEISFCLGHEGKISMVRSSSKRVASRYRRKGYRYRRRRYRRYRKRTYRSRRRVYFPKNTEVKCIAKQSHHVLGTENENNVAGEVMFCKFYPMVTFHICAFSPENAQYSYMMYPYNGIGSQGRIGAKIEPVKLRLSGSISLLFPTDNQIDQYHWSHQPSFWQVRLLVYQVKGGDPNYTTNSVNYHHLEKEPKPKDDN